VGSLHSQGVVRVDFSEAIKSGYRQYFTLRGRATRSEYWYFVLYIVLLGIAALILVVALMGVSHGLAKGQQPQTLNTPNIGAVLLLSGFALVPFAAILLSLVPLITLQVRRLHDVGQPGWWVLASAILSGITQFYTVLEKTQPAVKITHGLLALSGLVCSLFLLYFFVQPSDRDYNKYDQSKY